MELEISRQLLEAAVALALGAAAGALYDVFRVLRAYLRSPAVTLITDALFGLSCGLALFFAGMTAGGGRQRIFMPVLAALGGAAYFGAVSPLLLPLLRAAAAAAAFVLRCLGMPFIWSYIVLKKIYTFFKNIFHKLKKWYTIKHHGVKVALRHKKRRSKQREVMLHEAEASRSFYEDPSDRAACVRGHYAYRPSLQNRGGRG